MLLSKNPSLTLACFAVVITHLPLDALQAAVPVQTVGEAMVQGGHAVAVSGNHAYVVSETIGLQIMDISNPSMPLYKGVLDTDGYAWEIEVVDNLAFVASIAGGLTIINVTDPDHPVRIGQLQLNGWTGDVKIRGSIAYLARGFDGIDVVDVSDPTSPSRILSLDTPGFVTEIYLSGNHAYVTDRTFGIQIYDISFPSTPYWVGNYKPSGGSAYGIAVVGQYAYLADMNLGLQIIDISIPSLPRYIGGLSSNAKMLHIVVVNDVAYVSNELSTGQVIDVTRRSMPSRVGDFPATTTHIDVRGELVFSAWLSISSIGSPNDIDTDTVLDNDDNCRFSPNADQADVDVDGWGDPCDNCPATANPEQADFDHDEVGDACDSDKDGDGLLNAADNCPDTANADQLDLDHDGIGDACDSDLDNDGYLNPNDNCPVTANAGQQDLDGDNVGDACDNCPNKPNPDQCDLNGNITGDICENMLLETGLRFDGGDDFVTIPHRPSLAFGTANFTLETWFKTGQTGRFILDKRADVLPGEVGFFIQVGPEGRIIFALEVSEQMTNETAIQSDVSFTDNNWHHAAGVREGSAIRLYIDGQLQASGTLTLPMNITNTAPIILGRRHTPEAYFLGSLDELRIWSVARTQAQIDAFLHSRVTADMPGLISAYSFYGECSDQAIHDHGSAGNDGFLGASAASVELSDPIWFLSDAPVGPASDIDGDGVPDLSDNCPSSANGGQEDGDHDGHGDVCDNCPQVPNPDQADQNHNGVGNACDDDADSDGLPNVAVGSPGTELEFAL